MTRGDHERVREALRETRIPSEGQAEERGWQTVRQAFTQREPAGRGRGVARKAGIALAGAGAAAVIALSPAGASVRDWIADAFEGDPEARPVLRSLPAPGAVLTDSPDGAWVVGDDGARRRLGDYRRATWSPSGIFVGAAEGRELFALTPQGEVRWTVAAPGRIASLDWSSDEGVRIAYVAGDELRVVAGDGTGDAAVAGPVASPGIAWRPESIPGRARHQLAYVDRANRVSLIDTDSRAVLWRSAPIAAPVDELQWSERGDRLLVAADAFALVLAADGTSPLKGPVATGADAATLAPDGRHVAVVRPSRKGGEELALVPVTAAGDDGGERILYPTKPAAIGAGFGPPSFSPDGEWILLPWPRADQWLFIRIADLRREAVADISRQLDSDRRGRAFFPRVAGWCCADEP